MEGTTEKICLNCGERLPIDTSFCDKCGTRVEGEVQDTEQAVKEPSFFEKNKKKIGVGIAAIVALALILFIVNAVQASNLKKLLEEDWQTVEGEEGSYILCILDFSDDEIEYRLETGYAWLDMTVATYDYKVISGNQIKVSRYGNNWETFTIKFNEDKTMMIVEPALTSVDRKEYWFNFD